MSEIENATRKQSKAYTLLFLVENMLRVSMHNIMVSKIGTDYFREDIFPEYEYLELVGPNKKINICRGASEKKSSEKHINKCLGYTYAYLWYIDFRILLSMLNAFSSYFDPIFVNNKTKDDILIRLRNIDAVRNSLAHNRFISDVDLADIQSLHTTLDQGLNKIYLADFVTLALNPSEILICKFSDTLQQLLTMIKKGDFIDRKVLRVMKSQFSAILSLGISQEAIKDLEHIIMLISEFNKLPRKPGQRADISSFLAKTGLDSNISDFMNKLGVKI
jgi:hypothetical protein